MPVPEPTPPPASPPPPTDFVHAELARYEARGEIVPGSAETLARIWGTDLRGRPHPVIAEQVCQRLHVGFGLRFLNPEHVAPVLPSGAAYSSLRVELERRAAGLAPGAVDALMSKYSAELGGMPAHVLAGEVVRVLGERQNGKFLAVAPPVPAGERVIMDRLLTHFPEVRSPGDAAFSWRSQGLERLDEHAFVRLVAARLSNTVACKGVTHGDSPLPKSDPRLKASAPRTSAPDADATRSRHANLG